MAQIASAVLVSGGVYALIALGFAISFRISRVFNLAHGSLLLVSAYINYGMALAGSPSWLSIPLALLAATLLGTCIEGFLIPQARAAGLDDAKLLILSWLLVIIVQNIIAILFSNASIYMGVVSSGISPKFPLTPIQLVTLSSISILSLLVFLFFRYTDTGREAIAVGDDPSLAQIYGINVRRIVFMNSTIAGFFAAGAGLLLSYEERLDPSLALRFSIVAIVATLIGRPWGPAGAFLGGITLAFFESLVLYAVNPALRNAAVYLLLFFVASWVFRRQYLPGVA